MHLVRIFRHRFGDVRGRRKLYFLHCALPRFFVAFFTMFTKSGISTKSKLKIKCSMRLCKHFGQYTVYLPPGGEACAGERNCR